ncbi:MAG: hypothetical protein OEW87_05190 [Flavobacteriaceae bacterium]|nr:hypothetical protein [Flavobacteriaceae bacterium]
MIESGDNLFIDTSIQIERKICPPPKKDELNEILALAGSLFSSTYVKMEYRRSLVRDFVFIFNMLTDSENFGEILYKINRLPSLQQRRITRMIGGLAEFFLDQNELISESKGKEFLERAYHYFKPLIEFSMEDFDDSVDLVDNQTDCYIAKGIPTLKGKKFDNRISQCKPGEINCKIVEFFKENINYFKKIFYMLSKQQNLDSELEKMKNILEKAIKHPINMADYRNCWNCGDSIIAVESPEDYIIYTKNEKHLYPICKAINKKIAVF